MIDLHERNPGFLKAARFFMLAAVCGSGMACAKSATVRTPLPSDSASFLASAPSPRGGRDNLKDAVADFASSQAVKAGIRTVTFKYDSYGLDEEARAILKMNAELLRLSEDFRVIIEGHCDEYGTTEYNIALGERRAYAVREFYRMLGISSDRVRTMSYGKEQPLCLGEGEDCHQMNRRARTVVQ